MTDKIKAELEKRVAYYEDKHRIDDTHNRVRVSELREILAFIESLEEAHEESCDEIVFHAISKVCDTDKPEIFARHNETVYKVAKMAVEMTRDEAMEKEQDVDLEKEIKHMVECEREYMNFQVKRQLISYMARHFYKLGLNAKENTPKIKGWVARDECEDILFGKGLCIHSRKPERNGDCWSAFTILMHLSWDMFPELKWEDNPLECELSIKLL